MVALWGGLGLLAGLAVGKTVTLSNVEVPVDQNGDKMITGEGALNPIPNPPPSNLPHTHTLLRPHSNIHC